VYSTVSLGSSFSLSGAGKLQLSLASNPMQTAHIRVALIFGVTLALSAMASACCDDFLEEPQVLHGRFVASIGEPALTSFGLNYQSFIFETMSPHGRQFVRIMHAFALFEPQIPSCVLDYKQSFEVVATHSNKCSESVANMSKRYAFDDEGRFIGFKSAIEYSKGVPALPIPHDQPLQCYVVSVEDVSLIQPLQ
jgi:hypothetical protein